MIILDFHSKTPIYEQIEEQVMLMVRRGVYKPHDRLPSTRSLASGALGRSALGEGKRAERSGY